MILVIFDESWKDVGCYTHRGYYISLQWNYVGVISSSATGLCDQQIVKADIM